MRRHRALTAIVSLAQATCPSAPASAAAGGLLACAVMARSHDSVLVTWAPGEPEPTTAPAPLPGHQQLWAVSGQTLLISENGCLSSSDGDPTWFAAQHDATVIGERRPGAAVAASEDRVVVGQVDGERVEYLSVYGVTQAP